MISNNEIENRFIAEELDIHGDTLVTALKDAITDKHLIAKSNLLNSLSYKADSSSKRLSISFITYGRIHDLKRNNGIRHESPDTNALIWGIKKTKKRNKRKNKYWYAKTAYGLLGKLSNSLMYGLSEIERKRITDQLNKEFTKTTVQL